jgi:NodT family efflux transporter outer membrane factor (OMF) lipoprotein
MSRRAVLPVLAAAGLAACTVGPDYRKPEMAAPPAFARAASMPRIQVSAAEPDLAAWWDVFGDPLLSGLVRRGLADNPDLQAAASRIREARDQVRVTAAAEWPSINASANAIAFNSNRKSPGGGGGGQSGGQGAPSGGGFALPSHLNLYSAGFDATWEVDLFGGTRRAIESADATAEAAVWTRRDAQVSLAAEIANDYLTLRALQARIAIDQDTLARQRDLFGLIRARRQSGFTTELDVNQQTGQVAAAAAAIPQLEAQAKAQVHALGVLLGQPPEALIETLKPAAATTLPPPPPALPVGLPSELLERRPDVRAAERRVAAANAQIGVQEANLFPKLNLIGLASFAGMSLGDLFSSRNLSSVGVGMLSQPLFNAGKTHAAIAAAREEKTQADLAYRTAVLGAFKDVEDALARLEGEEQRRQALLRSVAAARNSLGIARSQYQAGLVNFINVLQAENLVLTSQDQLTQTDAQALSDLVSLYKALGGGWTA